MTDIFRTLDPYALVIGWIVVAAVVFAGLVVVIAIIGALLTGLIPLKVAGPRTSEKAGTYNENVRPATSIHAAERRPASRAASKVSSITQGRPAAGRRSGS